MATLAELLGQVRQRESSNDYTSQESQGPLCQIYGNCSTASGAYGFINATWDTLANASGYGSYAGSPAYLAPPAVQDAVASFGAQNYDPNSSFLWQASAPSGGYPQVVDTLAGLGTDSAPSAAASMSPSALTPDPTNPFSDGVSVGALPGLGDLAAGSATGEYGVGLGPDANSTAFTNQDNSGPVNTSTGCVSKPLFLGMTWTDCGAQDPAKSAAAGGLQPPTIASATAGISSGLNSLAKSVKDGLAVATSAATWQRVGLVVIGLIVLFVAGFLFMEFQQGKSLAPA